MTSLLLLWAVALVLFIALPSWPLAAVLASPLVAIPLWQIIRAVERSRLTRPARLTRR